MNFTREELIATTEYMKAIAEGYKIYTDFNDRFMIFSVRKRIRGETFDYPMFPHKKIYDLHFFKQQLSVAISEIEKVSKSYFKK